MTKYTFTGDIHGKVERVEQALEKEGKKIFVGDFIDSFDRSLLEHRKCFNLVLDAIKSNKDVEAIYGNHELSYLMPWPHKCSGWNLGRYEIMMEFREEINKYFKPFILLKKNFLVSHAGLTKRLWKENNLSFDNLGQTLAEWWPDINSPMHRIGRSRSGPHSYGGLFWCDFNKEFQPVKGLNQVFGHTEYGGKEGIRCIKTETENSWCIDCFNGKPEFLELEL